MNVNKRLTAWTALLIVWTAVLLVATGGCSKPIDSSGESEMDALARQLDKPEPVAEEPAPPVEEPPAEEAPLEVVTAKSPQRGRSLQGGGYLSAVASARFWAEHQLILHSVTHALNLSRAEKGHYPKTHEDFMRDVIEYNNIQLPFLPPGYEYVYDPEDPLTLKMRNTGAGEPGALE